MSTTTMAPERSTEQRMDALKRANYIRTRRSQLKRDIKAGRRTAEHLLLAPPQWIDTMKVYDLLLAVPKWGRVKANEALRWCEIAPSKTVGGLSPRQRDKLLRWLGRR